MASIDLKKKTSLVEYEQYSLAIEDMRMQYYSSYSIWRSNRTGSRPQIGGDTPGNSDIFNLLEDLSVRLQVNIKQKRAGMLIMTQE